MEIFEFAQRVHEKFPSIPMNTMLDIWCDQQDIPISVFYTGDIIKQKFKTDDLDKPELKTCKHMYFKGRYANTPCKIKVKRNGDYCSKHKPNY